jgi:hypothetical protein
LGAVEFDPYRRNVILNLQKAQIELHILSKKKAACTKGVLFTKRNISLQTLTVAKSDNKYSAFNVT